VESEYKLCFTPVGGTTKKGGKPEVFPAVQLSTFGGLAGLAGTTGLAGTRRKGGKTRGYKNNNKKPYRHRLGGKGKTLREKKPLLSHF
jgi:hypothetical protein